MLKQLHLTNFGRHTDLTVDFAPGVNAISAANEFGKTTVMKAVAYALFGTKALPDNLDDTVTWGEPANSLRVKLDFTVGGTDYTITRSKGSAELRYADQSVTGQTETAKFVADLLGADAGLAANLVIAGQNEIRGALQGGAKGAVALIEKLADFDQLDELIDLLQSNLVTGNTSAAKAALEQAQDILDETPEPEPLDDEVLQAQVDSAVAAAAQAQANTKHLQGEKEAAERAHRQAIDANQRYRDLTSRTTERREVLQGLKSARPPQPQWSNVEEGALQAAQRAVSDLERSVRDAKARTKGEELNAERYRLLRHCDLDDMAEKYWPGREVPTGVALDIVIDAAIAAQGERT